MVVTCLRCADPDWVEGKFCTERDAPLPLTGEEDYFSILGLDRVLGLDPGRLKFAYFELSRRLHPDGHFSDSPEVQEAMVRTSAFLNDLMKVIQGVQLQEDPAVPEAKLREAEAQVRALKETALRCLDDLGRRWDALARPGESFAPRAALLDEMLNHLDESAYADRLLQAVEESRTPEPSGKGNE